MYNKKRLYSHGHGSRGLLSILIELNYKQMHDNFIFGFMQ